MAELLAQWLNEEVGLSKVSEAIIVQKVTNFEEDFASGYLFGELLYKFNQQSDFELFSLKNATSHYVMNFEKLEPTFRSLGVQFNSKTVEKIMMRDRGQALRMLYQLKIILEKVYPPADISIVAKTGTFGDNQPAKRIAQSKPKYDEVSSTFFKQRLGKLNRAQKDIDLEHHLQHFEEEMNRQASQAAKLDQNDVLEDAKKKQEMRRIQINKLQRNAGFMEEWLAKGVEDWKTNMNVKKDREAATLEFDFTQAEKYNNHAQKKLKEAQDEVQDGIKNFERNLKAQGINTKVSKEQADKAVLETLQGKTWQPQVSIKSEANQEKLDFTKTFDSKVGTKKGNFTLTSTGLKQRTKKTVTDEQKNEREKRRRRLINQQANLYTELENQKREDRVTEFMRRQSRQEKELDYEAWRTTQCKNVIIECRKLREAQYEKRRIYDVETAIEKEQKLITEMQAASEKEIQQMVKRTGELKQYEKQLKLKQRAELCSEMMDAIFDIADEAYNHMQDLDSKTWDTRNWNEWLQLFTHKKPITGAMAQLVTESTDSETQRQLDESELIDYIKNGGQWPATLVSKNKLNLMDVINPKIEAAAAPVKGAKPAGKVVAQQEVQFEEGDLELTDRPVNNFLFGDAIDQLNRLYYPQRPNLKHPPTPNWLALKICLVGYPFAGKKEQAQQIRETYGLDVYVMDELINEAINFDQVSTRMQPATQLNEPGYEDLSEDEQLKEDVNEEMAEIGAAIKEQLLDGKEVSDDLYVRLFICKLRTSYAYKCPITKRKEVEHKALRYVQINQRLGEIQVELAKDDLSKKQKRSLVEEQAAIEVELSGLDKLDTNGWVLVDFPCSYAQAKLLEEAISGYKPHKELEQTEREKRIEEAKLLMQPSPQQQQPVTLIPSGLDAVIWFNVPIEECLRRSVGRRFDLQDPQQHYYLYDMQQPVDANPLCERLLPLSEDHNAVQGLPDRFVAFDQTTRSMVRWLKSFGDEESNRILVTFLDAAQQRSEVASQIASTLDLILDRRFQKFEGLRNDLAIKIQAKLDAEKQAAAEELQESSQVQEVPKPTHSPQLSQSNSQSKGVKNPKGSQAALIPPTAITAPEEPTAPIVKQAPKFSRDNIEVEFRPVLIKLWEDLSCNYKSQMKKIFRNIRKNREVSFKAKAGVQQKFLVFLQRSDNKQELLDNFVRDYNQFTDDYPDLREDTHTKEELHQRCDVLSDELWEIVEERKEQNIEERKKIMESGATEFDLEFLTFSAQQLMQAELDKFKVTVQIIHDYYFAIEEKSTHEITAPSTNDLTFEGEELPPVETIADGADLQNIASYNYPRLEKLLQMSLKQQIIPDVTQIQAAVPGDKKGAKAAPAKKGQPTKDQEEMVIEESQFVKEMKEALRVEKSILRFRLVQIRNWSIQRLQETRQQALRMYKKFEDWIIVSQKSEMATIDEMCAVVKRAIEDEVKIQNELRIKFMDFSVDESTLNYINPPIPKLEALESYRNDRFAIPQLQSIYTELERITRTNGDLIQINELRALLLSKIKNSVHFGGFDSSVPESWNSFGLIHIHQMIRNIDSNNTGYVNWRTLMTYLILLRSKVPTAKEISRIEQMLGSDCSCDKFISSSFWFDETERSTDRENAVVFERVKMIKELLFKTHSTKEGFAVMRLATTLGQISQRAQNEQASFYELLFSKVRI